ncbi:unnamed protein product [Pedinophyceae sp. YPF-701]|nr:unnamed protein product [Pedinophyceae sp. YPF-701]
MLGTRQQAALAVGVARARVPRIAARRAPSRGRAALAPARAARNKLATAPSLTDAEDEQGNGRNGGPSPPPGPNPVQRIWNKALRQLASLPLAIAELGVIAALSAVGTFIEQNKPYDYYYTFYPDGDQKVLGFLTGDLIISLGIDHIYTSPYFVALLLLFAGSLSACTLTRQVPAIKVAKNWRWAETPKAVLKNPFAESLPGARVRDLAELLRGKGYQVFTSGDKMYAFTGIVGRYAPVAVHAAMILCLIGFGQGLFGGWTGNVIIPEGGEALVASAIEPASPLATLPSGGGAVLRVNDFSITYRPNGEAQQFYSDVSVVSPDTGKELKRKTTYVNDPLRFGGITAYQTDWGISAVRLKVTGGIYQTDDGSPVIVQLPMAFISGAENIQGRAWASFLPVERPSGPGARPRGIPIIARDLQSVIFYTEKGDFGGVRRPGSGTVLHVDIPGSTGLDITVEQMLGSTGLQLKADPGIPAVYAGFGLLILTTFLSFLSFNQVWALQEGSTVHVGGRTNRATIEFEQELSDLLDQVPEVEPEVGGDGAAGASA